jgi:hypothetical protein
VLQAFQCIDDAPSERQGLIRALGTTTATNSSNNNNNPKEARGCLLMSKSKRYLLGEEREKEVSHRLPVKSLY